MKLEQDEQVILYNKFPKCARNLYNRGTLLKTVFFSEKLSTASCRHFL